MIKLNKDTLEFEFIDTLTCHCGGGSDDSGGGSDDNNPNADAARTQDVAAGFPVDSNRNDEPDRSNPSEMAQRERNFIDQKIAEGVVSNRDEAAAIASGNAVQALQEMERRAAEDQAIAFANNLAQRQSDATSAMQNLSARSVQNNLANVEQSQFLNLPASQGRQIDLRTGLPVNSQTSQTATVVMGGGTDDMGSGNPITDLTAPVVMGGGSDDMGSGNPIIDLTKTGRPDVYKDKVIRDAGNDAMAQADGFANAQERDFYMGLAGNARQGNDYLEQVRGLNDRGFLGNQIAAGIGKGGIPVLNQNGEIMGVNTTRDFMGIPVTTYTGRSEFAPNYQDEDLTRNGADDDPIVPLQQNPLTGTEQCPDGYEFDEDLQACKMKSERKTGTRDTSGERFYRATSLDNAPANVPAGFDFAAANRNFVNSFAYNPLNYRKPMGLDGFSKVSGLL